ncbi:MAG: glycosyltransferase family 4 protein [Patescibacteria group bacterium]|nr:glycosyltransferase family 4 protein [Patescibacteria group bacterium]
MSKNKKMICILTSAHPIFDIRIFNKQAKTLVQAGYDVTLIAQHDKEEVVDGIKIIPLPKPKKRFERFLRTDYLIYRKALEQRANIYHFHDPELLPWTLRLKKKTGAKIIYDAHEDYHQAILSKPWLPSFLRKITASIFNFYEKHISKKFDYIITATPHITQTFKQKNVADVKNYPLIDKKIIIDNNLKKKNITLIYTGGIEKIRGIKEIIRSLRYIKYDISLKLIGCFSDKNFEQEIKMMPEWKKVDFSGQIKFEHINRELENANIGLALYWPEPNHIEALPNKIFEYMTAGLPIVASNFPLWKEIVENNNCGICVNPLKVNEIAETIEYLIEHPDEAKKMGENGRKATFEKYNWENESKKLLKIYNKLLE